MKFLLTIMVCSVVTGECYTPPDYPKTKDSHYQCVRDGLGETYEALIADSNFTEEQIEKLRLYPKYICQPIVVPPPKPNTLILTFGIFFLSRFVCFFSFMGIYTKKYNLQVLFF